MKKKEIISTKFRIMVFNLSEKKKKARQGKEQRELQNYGR